MRPYENPAIPVRERVEDLLSRMTTDEKIGLLSTHQLPVPRLGIKEWYVGHEIARGLVNREEDRPSTVFPQPIGMAASFDPEMMLEIGKTAAREARAYANERPVGGLMVWGPTVDLSRDPRWGRTEECYGEDPCLTGEMSAMYTRGLRGEERVWATIPTLKHFCANNHEQERIKDNANLTPRLRHEHYYTAFRTPVIQGGAHSVMTAYNEICHAPAVMNHDLRRVLKKEWGLGFVVTDGADFSQNVLAHHTFDSHARALQACLYAGADCMTDSEECVHAAARLALAQGLISEADIDRAVGNTLESRFLLGHFDQETPYDHLTRADVNTPDDRALNLRAALEGIVLLENNGLLPLRADKHRRIGLFGCNADANLLDWYTGTSSYRISIRQGLTDHGCEVVYDPGWDTVKLLTPNGRFLRLGEDECLYADADADDASEFWYCEHADNGGWTNFRHVGTGRFLYIEGDAVKLGKNEIYGWFTSETFRVTRRQFCPDGENPLVISDYLHGRQLCLDADGRLVCRPKARPDRDVFFACVTVSEGAGRIRALARECDAAVYCGGNDPEQYARECYDRDTILLPRIQRTSIRALHDAGTPFVLVLVSSYPYALGDLHTLPDAVLWTCHAGPELGPALARTLFGAYNPAGRCPVTWYASDDDLPDIGDYDIMKNKMTYRWFDGVPLYPFGYGLSYSRFSYEGLEAAVTPEGIRVSASIRNDSDVDGQEVVQVYAHAQSQRIARPILQLCAFGRIGVPAGATVRFVRTIPFRELEIYDVTRERLCLEAGTFDILLGASSADIRCRTQVEVPGETIPARDLRAGIRAELADDYEGTEIFAHPLTGQTHVRGMRWNNVLTFLNCDMTGTQEIVLHAAAPVEPLTLRVYLDDAPEPAALVTVPSCDAPDDLHACRAPLHADGCHTLRIVMPQGASLGALRTLPGKERDTA
ncbi:MAG: glycoside hydrolase family 3 C-terminal domain-containing protein [Oscillospiraceae bacterium]|nr:glycoside hydrolase family 3 C-terminal domain-containing protein [Oscillospiraceae bacterium]